MIRAAVIDHSRKYRYSLIRQWAPLPADRLLFIMLNPSTADATQDDATIRRCIGFAKIWGYGSIEVVNLFAFRATHPAQLLTVNDPIGEDNDAHIAKALDRAHNVVAAWGANRFARNRAEEILYLCERAGHVLWCLGLTKEGLPRHPVRLPRELSLRPFMPEMKR